MRIVVDDQDSPRSSVLRHPLRSCAPSDQVALLRPAPPVLRRSLATSVVRFSPSRRAAACLLPLVRRSASSIRRYSNSSTARLRSMPSSVERRPRDLLLGDERADVRRQVVDANDAVLAEDDQALDQVLELAHVARPVVLPQVDHGVVGDLTPAARGAADCACRGSAGPAAGCPSAARAAAASRPE